MLYEDSSYACMAIVVNVYGNCHVYLWQSSNNFMAIALIMKLLVDCKV